MAGCIPEVFPMPNEMRIGGCYLTTRKTLPVSEHNTPNMMEEGQLINSSSIEGDHREEDSHSFLNIQINLFSP